MKSLKIFGLATALLWCMGLHAELIAVQEAIEAHDIKVMVYNSGDGYVLARSCASCPFTRLDIDRNTAVTVDGKPVKVSKRIEKHWSGGIVIYDIKTNHVARLKL
jgi:hypothetical protein